MNFNKAEFERFLARPDPSITALLFFGPDQGLAHERAMAAQKLVLGAGEDPFRLAELTAREVNDDPARLLDELSAIAMLGGRRVVRVRPAIEARHNEGIAEAVLSALEGHVGPERSLLIVEAGDLPAKHALVKAFAAPAHAAAVRCYHDSIDDLRQAANQFLRAEGYAIQPDALDYLVGHLGDDRGVTRQELLKLVLYVGKAKNRIEREDVEAVIGDQSEIALDDMIGALCDGDAGSLLRAFDRCVVDSDPIQLLRACARHFMRLHFLLGQMRKGESFESAAAGLRPPLFWALKTRIERQCRLWDEGRVGASLVALTETEARAMRFHEISATVARDGLMAIAGLARQAEKQAGRR